MSENNGICFVVKTHWNIIIKNNINLNKSNE